jgi:hypothetical protein
MTWRIGNGAENNTVEAADKTKKDLRRSHFNLGNNPMEIESSHKSAFKELELGKGPNNTSAIRDRM